MIVSLVTFLSAQAQTSSQKDFLTIKEAMDIVSYRFCHPMRYHENQYENYIKNKIKNHGYIEKAFLGDGIGTCSFWQYIKGGHVVITTDQEFIPDNKQLASTVAVIDCEGVDENGGDDLAISVELSVFSERSWAILMRQMQDIGFEFTNSIDDWNVYCWHTYEIKVQKMPHHGYDRWEFDIRLTKPVYNTTKHVAFEDSARSHDVYLSIDYPVCGNPALLKQTRRFIMEALEFYETDSGMARYNRDQIDGQALVNYYGRQECASLDKDYYDQLADDPDYHFCCHEMLEIGVVGENDNYISFEVFGYRNCGGSSDYLIYGATFRKSDGKRLKVIANPQDPRFKRCLNQLDFEDRHAIYDEYKEQLPMPEHEPYLIQDGVRFVYQKGEITLPPIITESPYSVMGQFLTEEVKELLK